MKLPYDSNRQYTGIVKDGEEFLIKVDHLRKLFSQYHLTERELQIAHLWINNYTIKSIATKLYLSEGTVRNYTKSIYRKTNTKGRAQLINRFYRLRG